jgi:HPr kinase/phosphorylase
MLSAALQLINQLDLSRWKEILERSSVDVSRLIQTIEPLSALRFLMNDLQIKEGAPVLFEEEDLSILRVLKKDVLKAFLERVINIKTPVVILSCSDLVFEKGRFAFLTEFCKSARVCLVQSSLSPFYICLELQKIHERLQMKSLEIHGTMVDVFGLGVLLSGASGVGKSETALGLIERRHRLIGDDLIRVVRQGDGLMTSAVQMTRHHIEIRGIGILNIAHMFGIVSVKETKRLDMVVELEGWSREQEYDRLGLDWHYSDFLGIKVPHHKLPVKPGRDLVLLIETMALNHRLRQMGFNSARDMQQRLQEEINKKDSVSRGVFEERAGL